MGLKRGVVLLDNYSENWVKQYLLEETFLKDKLKNYILEIEHVGSTSIPGIKAKPIIDILIVIESLNKIDEIENILSKYGYYNRGGQGVDDRCFFAKGEEDARTHYIHFTTFKSKTYYNLLYFKKYLIEHPEYITRYCDLKEELAKKYRDDRKKYTAEKNNFIKAIINLAMEEYGC